LASLFRRSRGDEAQITESPPGKNAGWNWSPSDRGKEIDAATFEAHADTIFTQAENRLHVQKAILNWAVA
jgi:hypothetical protein